MTVQLQANKAFDAQDIERLVQDHQVHRDVYTSQDVYALEMQHLFANVWVFVGHESQTPKHGDYFTTQIGSQPVIQVRHSDGKIKVLHNRCPHKGTKIAIDRHGNTGTFFRCPYHAWSFETDGRLKAVPLESGYSDTCFETTENANGIKPVGAVHNHRGFVFARLADSGISFDDFFGDSLSSIDNMVDRSPEGRLEVAGPPLRYMHKCNWKMLVENQTDTCHPMVAHQSSAGTAVRIWEELGNFEAMCSAHGETRAKAILDENRHNTIYFPNIMVKGPIQQLRNFIPIGPDKTLVESYIYRLVGAPDELLARTAMYNRMINAPTSIVGHDDLEMYERAQEGLLSDGQERVNLQRLHPSAPEDFSQEAVENGTTERQMRNQFDAWKNFMTSTMPRNASRKGSE